MAHLSMAAAPLSYFQAVVLGAEIIWAFFTSLRKRRVETPHEKLAWLIKSENRKV